MIHMKGGFCVDKTLANLSDLLETRCRNRDNLMCVLTPSVQRHFVSDCYWATAPNN